MLKKGFSVWRWPNLQKNSLFWRMQRWVCFLRLMLEEAKAARLIRICSIPLQVHTMKSLICAVNHQKPQSVLQKKQNSKTLAANI
jgi:hypothetical protein